MNFLKNKKSNVQKFDLKKLQRKNFLRIKTKKLTKYLNTKKYLLFLRFRKIQRDYDTNKKIVQSLGLLLDIAITGAAISFVVNYRNFLSYGIASFLVLYYVEKIVGIIRGQNKKE